MKKGSETFNHFGAREISVAPREGERRRANEKMREREKKHRIPFLFLPSSCPIISWGTLRSSRPSASQLGSHRARPVSQSRVRISLRGSNVSAEGLLDGSSSDNSQVSGAYYYTLECKRDAKRSRKKEREKEFRFRVQALPYKRNLMGQLNRYYRRVHKWLFNF